MIRSHFVLQFELAPPQEFRAADASRLGIRTCCNCPDIVSEIRQDEQNAQSASPGVLHPVRGFRLWEPKTANDVLKAATTGQSLENFSCTHHVVRQALQVILPSPVQNLYLPQYTNPVTSGMTN